MMSDDVFQTLNNHWANDIYKAPNIKIYKLKNVFVVAEGLVFTESGGLITETQSAHSFDELQKARIDIYEAISNRESTPHCLKAILCKQRGADNYGHWLVEMLPKAYLVRRELNLDWWPIAVHRTSTVLQSVMADSLDVLGVSGDNIIITSDKPTFFDELIVVHGLTAHSIYISSPVFECMEFISSQIGLGSAERVYAVRRPARSRDFANEHEAREIFHKHGFSEIETAALSFREQVKAFKSAKRIVGPMGAALTNIIFCRPGTEVIVFMPANALELLFWLIAEGKELDSKEVRCSEVGQQQGALPWDRSIEITSNYIDQILSNLAGTCSVQNKFQNADNQKQNFLLTRERLCSSEWRWFLNIDSYSGIVVRFLQNGKFFGHSHENESYWEINAGILEIFSTSGLCTWRFEDFSEKNSKFRMRSRFKLLPIPNILVLTEL
jgi:capsular polysaccharide biosynthesis protein